MNAWVTLLTQPNYLIGVRTLRASLAASGSEAPLVVMVTSEIDESTRRLLADEGCLVRDVAPLRPAGGSAGSYANSRFAEVWTKLAVWGLTEFERVVFLDADMLVTQNMDELFSLDLPDGAIAACHACRCNPNRIASYPPDWMPATCFYTYCRGGDHVTEPGATDNYLNGGFLVLSPDGAVFAEMLDRLAIIDDLSRYPFAEQDFLNEFYSGRWRPLPYVYNALKTLPHQHPSVWQLSSVKNIHYIIDKPWEKPLDPTDRYFEVNRLWWEMADTLGVTVER
ncbi:glycosyl transferase [Subtercola boreus]|uniref:Glycosyl transferase n=1 Tax=Subtercola boreus TaxID=120213 RepID=A0A3E0VVW4_9MICO|nr:glycosyltransferase family 8 protein [Subtercola boreus]RFA13901.1 glycosyl transferase [Subtercola boreus]